MLPDRSPERACLGPAVVCGFLTSCRKDFTTGVQVAMKMHLLKLGTVKQEGLSMEEVPGERRRCCLSSLGSRRKKAFGDRFRGSAWDQLPAAHCLRGEETPTCGERSGGRRREREWCRLLPRGRAHPGSFAWRLLSFLHTGILGEVLGGFQWHIHQFSR